MDKVHNECEFASSFHTTSWFSQSEVVMEQGIQVLWALSSQYVKELLFLLSHTVLLLFTSQYYYYHKALHVHSEGPMVHQEHYLNKKAITERRCYFSFFFLPVAALDVDWPLLDVGFSVSVLLFFFWIKENGFN